jgi:hypothetical protein
MLRLMTLKPLTKVLLKTKKRKWKPNLMRPMMKMHLHQKNKLRDLLKFPPRMIKMLKSRIQLKKLKYRKLLLLKKHRLQRNKQLKLSRT